MLKKSRDTWTKFFLQNVRQQQRKIRLKQRWRRGRNDGNDYDLRACNDRRIKEIPWTWQISIRLIYPWEDKVSWRSVVRLRYTQKRLPARHWKCDRHLIGTRYPVTRVTNFSVFYLGSAPRPLPLSPRSPRSPPLRTAASSPRSRPFSVRASFPPRGRDPFGVGRKLSKRGWKIVILFTGTRLDHVDTFRAPLTGVGMTNVLDPADSVNRTSIYRVSSLINFVN